MQYHNNDILALKSSISPKRYIDNDSSRFCDNDIIPNIPNIKKSQQRYIDKYNFQYRDDDIAKKKIIF